MKLWEERFIVFSYSEKHITRETQLKLREFRYKYACFVGNCFSGKLFYWNCERWNVLLTVIQRNRKARKKKKKKRTKHCWTFGNINSSEVRCTADSQWETDNQRSRRTENKYQVIQKLKNIFMLKRIMVHFVTRKKL